MRSDKFGGDQRNGNFDAHSHDGWEETQQIFQSRNREKEQQKQRQRQQRKDDNAYQQYLAMRENPDANFSPNGNVKPAVQKKKKSMPILADERDSWDDNKKWSRKEQKKQKKLAKKQGKKKKRGRRIAGVLLVLVLLLAAAGGTGVLFVMGLMEKVGTVEVDRSDLGINPQVAQDLKDYRNIALLGVDARDMDKYDESRTDAIIILSMDMPKKEIRQISVYRDTYLHVNEKYGYDKVTNVHAYAGTTATLHTLNENMDLNIRETVIVNWKAVADAIDGLGGIDIDIQDSEIQEMNKYIKDTQKNIGGPKKKIKKAGMQTLNGNQAVTYARIRKDSVEGDYRRNERMKMVVSAAVEKAKKTSPFKLNEIANEVLPQIRTNMDTNAMLEVLFEFFRGDMTKNAGWPFDTEGWYNYNGAWCGPPVTLERNVKKLHKKYFGQPDYNPTQAVMDISAEISRRTGYY